MAVTAVKVAVRALSGGAGWKWHRVVPLIAARHSEVAEGLQHVMQSFSRGRLPVL